MHLLKKEPCTNSLSIALTIDSLFSFDFYLVTNRHIYFQYLSSVIVCAEVKGTLGYHLMWECDRSFLQMDSFLFGDKVLLT